MKTPRGYALVVAVAYAATAATWIVVSGAVVAALPPDVARVIEVGKGLAFTIITH